MEGYLDRTCTNLYVFYDHEGGLLKQSPCTYHSLKLSSLLFQHNFSMYSENSGFEEIDYFQFTFVKKVLITLLSTVYEQHICTMTVTIQDYNQIKVSVLFND